MLALNPRKTSQFQNRSTEGRIFGSHLRFSHPCFEEKSQEKEFFSPASKIKKFTLVGASQQIIKKIKHFRVWFWSS